MTCAEYELQIGDDIEGQLDATAAAGLKRHLSGCTSCRAVAADLRAIQVAARSLEVRTPPPQVWTRIAAATEPGTETAHARRWWQPVGYWRQSLAAAAVVLLMAGVGWLGWRDLAPVNPAEGPIAVAARSATTDTMSADPAPAAETIKVAENDFVKAIAGLEEITNAGTPALDADTAGVVSASLTTLDQAIGESRAVLEAEPENEVAQQSLFEALRSKVALLQDVIALINEVAQGDQEGAARIISDMNNP